MPLKKKEKPKLNHRRRPTTEAELYKLRHAFDELPLDPVKSFIIERMRKSVTYGTYIGLKRFQHKSNSTYLN